MPAEIRHNVNVLPRKTARYYDSELRVMVRRTYGFQARCSCEWKGRTWDKYHDAHNEGMGHKFRPPLPDLEHAA